MLKNRTCHSSGFAQHYLFSKKKDSAGFTLIELLVVISIIGMLSSIVLASTHSAFIKAQNVASNVIVGQYRNALAQAYTTDGYYPDDGNPSSNCLGQANGNACNSMPPSSAINSVLANYYPTLPVLSPVKLGSTVYGNVIYTACGVPNTCQGYTLVWALLPSDAPNCSIGQISYNSSEFTWCAFDQFYQ